MIVSVKASDLARLAGQWRFVEVSSVYAGPEASGPIQSLIEARASSISISPAAARQR